MTDEVDVRLSTKFSSLTMKGEDRNGKKKIDNSIVSY